MKYISKKQLSSHYISYLWFKFIDKIKSNSYRFFDGRIWFSYNFHAWLKFDFFNEKRYLLWAFSVELGFIGFTFAYWHKKPESYRYKRCSGSEC